MAEEVKRFDLSLHLKREPVTLAVLTGLAVILFLAVTGLSHTYDAQRASLASEWSTRGTEDLKAQSFGLAVTDFRTALLYSRDNYSFQLSLAEALIGVNHTDEAYAYLINLWDREPENGQVNLELARIAAGNGQTERALRYYHDAIYATWPGDQEMERRNTRLELIDLLLRIDARTQAESELIALAANVSGDPSQQAHLGELFLRAQDYDRALDAFRLSLKSDRQNQAAMAGAGLAAFELGKYSVAQRYLRQAVSVAPGDTESAARLKTTELVLQMDPLRQQISAAERSRIAVAAFAVAGARLKTCGIPGGPAPPANSEQGLAQQWATLKPQISERALRRSPDLVNTTMDMVFNIERQTSGRCGAPTEADNALLLIAKLHEGN
ncbi:MAG TPA: tetratricopeptide repeat protein [Terracidiphilus sp.]|nr:tetratricopeptide repeat protein [Terracidiphilus sp.]